MSYLRPTQLTDALALIAAQRVCLVAGGTDLYPAAGAGGLRGELVDITAVKELQGIEQTATGIRIGAAVTWRELIDTDLPPAFNGLKAAAREVGSVQIQNAGTVAGNLCNASPAADGVPPLLTLDAEVVVVCADRGSVRYPLREFITGVRQTVLQPAQLVSAILVPTPQAHARSAFCKLGSRRYLVISIAMTAVLVSLDDDGLIGDIKIAVGACSEVAQRMTTLEANLCGQHPQSLAIDDTHFPEISPIDDVRGTACYRRDVVREQCIRAIQMACNND